MGLFDRPSPFDADVEKITDPKKTSEDWGLIMDFCDRVSSRREGPKDCLKSITKRLQNSDPHVALHAITLLDACVNNCGKSFKLEVASRDFEQTFKKLLSKSHPKVQEKLREMLKKWAEGEFKGDPQLNLIPSLYTNLKREGMDFSPKDHTKQAASLPKDPNVVSSQQEEEDIAKAIQMSLQETRATPETKQAAKQQPNAQQQQQQQSQQPQLYPTSSLYGNLGTALAEQGGNAGTGGKTPGGDAANGFKEPKKARTLYDFEAAEDNELTFKAGEIVIITDDSDENWWKGSNHRGEGLFPANFVSKDLDAEPEDTAAEQKKVQFNDDVEVKKIQDDPNKVAFAGPVSIDEKKIDQVLGMLHEADPTSGETDPPELPALENQVNQMQPLIDAELEGVDRRLAQLTRLSTELVDALNLYHQLMREMPAAPMYPGAYTGAMNPAAPASGGNMFSPPQQMAPPTMPGYPMAPSALPTNSAMMAGAPGAGAMGQPSADPYAWNPTASVPPGTMNPAQSTAPPQPQQPSFPALSAPTSSLPASSVPQQGVQNGYAYNPTTQPVGSDFPTQSMEAPIYSSN